jgi:hypothetical protein
MNNKTKQTKQNSKIKRNETNQNNNNNNINNNNINNNRNNNNNNNNNNDNNNNKTSSGNHLVVALRASLAVRRVVADPQTGVIDSRVTQQHMHAGHVVFHDRVAPSVVVKLRRVDSGVSEQQAEHCHVAHVGGNLERVVVVD